MHNKIVPCIWFHTTDGKISTVVEYYQALFGEDFKTGRVVPVGDTPSGNTEMCEVELYGQKYLLMATANEHHQLNDAVSFMINCDGQNEIDTFWNYFTSEGKGVQCGWCIDKFGLRWQIVPDNMNELMELPHAFEVMMQQQKIVIAAYYQ